MSGNNGTKGIEIERPGNGYALKVTFAPPAKPIHPIPPVPVSNGQKATRRSAPLTDASCLRSGSDKCIVLAFHPQ
ncbi:hypothetical protein CLV70_1175 [Pseudosporangium ferrugineum]|uniref:Uncharacterized protein n=1 Tax=Pseudosporangium ferrugineum TaxID=439699 RepID=A0A2T0RMF5_9ACTN|nr:hypothetical protein CLV70_1175 [Pseudosporangium ferrugineum]